jgi:hypothetical protein
MSGVPSHIQAFVLTHAISAGVFEHGVDIVRERLNAGV